MYRKAVVMKVLEIDRKLKMRVCYCEDEVAQAELFKKMVDKWSADNGTSVCMDIYESAEEFFSKGMQQPTRISCFICKNV